MLVLDKKIAIDRRSLLLSAAAGMLFGSSSLAPASAAASEPATPAPPADGAPFSYDLLSQAMKDRAGQPYAEEQAEIPAEIAELTYDQHRAIRYRPERAVWKGKAPFELHAFHMGWLFKQPVRLHSVADGMMRPLVFTPADFEYRPPLDPVRFSGLAVPGVAGFRLHYPLNNPDVMDELVAFLGASYFRALGRDTVYGISARGLAVNTATDGGEEFPRFTDFFIETPQEHSAEITIYAALDSPSLTGAYAFRIIPSASTLIDVTARLYTRADIERLGIAPMTSMFLFAENNHSAFDDYRGEVHDSDGLKIVRRSGEELWRYLNNPKHLANSFFGEDSPKAFGLFQRDRQFQHYQDAEARYERRPSLLVEPLNEWGKGLIHLVELPTSQETNDNIVAYWVPEVEIKAGQQLEFKYRLTWGAIEETGKKLARVTSLRTGAGGVSGVEGNGSGLRKFVVDFAGDLLRNLSAGSGVEATVNVSNGEIVHFSVFQIEPNDVWRLALDVRSTGDGPIELSAFLNNEGRRLSETWLYQWRNGDEKPF